MSKHHHHRDRSWAPAPEPLTNPTIDNHTHLKSVVSFARAMSHEGELKGQPGIPVYTVDDMLTQAAAVGIEGIIDCACEYPNLQAAVNMALAHPGQVHAALAIHPNEAVLHARTADRGPDGLEIKYKPYHLETSLDEAIQTVHDLAVRYPDQVVAIGETGIDLFRTGEQGRKTQIEAFRAHIALAKELNLPMQIHDRDAHRDCIETLLADGAPEHTVFHSFSGDAEMGRIAAENGWYLSFSGTVSYKGNDGIREALALTPRDHILVETDAPYLTAMPFRGRTNAPYLIPNTLLAMADVLGINVNEMAAITRENTRAVYGV